MTLSAAEHWTRLVTRVLAPNPGPMTLEGTNSLVIGEPGSGRVVVVDPGPADDRHLARLAGHGRVELILLTHHHLDHVEAAERFSDETGAPVRAFDPRLCRGTGPLMDGERIDAAGVQLGVVATPGHTADSASLHLPGDGPARPVGDGGDQRGAGTMITGDTILGRGTTIIVHPDGSLGAYLRSLERLAGFGAIPALPAHGPMLPDLSAVCARYATHREQRLAQVRAALQSLGRQPGGDPDLVAAVVDRVYTDIDPAVRFAAEASTRAQLEYLAQTSATGSSSPT